MGQVKRRESPKSQKMLRRTRRYKIMTCQDLSAADIFSQLQNQVTALSGSRAANSTVNEWNVEHCLLATLGQRNSRANRTAVNSGRLCVNLTFALTFVSGEARADNTYLVPPSWPLRFMT
ncbi:uncharacterized protein FMAN_07089 [Fusarium mangiferae]|uniref:Uncharacterized protein n=1 Tax=Fusarium mangiferae TaxID=192010 RepID=A0A1L7T0D0_FUSMA|nr:uncharacterized protein FMAN_07089 [Fusarium mangiferae]CVK92104.1 uncharacterized protein FMAN_07089 [Fusarium mangiferae]